MRNRGSRTRWSRRTTIPLAGPAAIQDARNQQVRLDEVISVEQCVKHTVVPNARLMPQMMIVSEHTRIMHSTPSGASVLPNVSMPEVPKSLSINRLPNIPLIILTCCLMKACS